jgi:hypothetical protein
VAGGDHRSVIQSWSAVVDPVPEALKSEALVVPTESLDLDGRIARLHRKLKPFIERLIGAAS